MVTLRLYLEQISGEWFAWMENFPGAYSQAAGAEAAVIAAPKWCAEHLAWLRKHGEALPGAPANGTAAFLPVVIETAQAAAYTPWTAARFGDFDLSRIGEEEIERLLRQMRYVNADLMEQATQLPPDEWDRARPGERSVRSVLDYVCETRMELLHALGDTPTIRPSPDPLIMLQRSLVTFESSLRQMVDQAVFASPADRTPPLRWALRVAIWHGRTSAALIYTHTHASAYLSAPVFSESNTVTRSHSGDGIGEHLPEREAGRAAARHVYASEYYY